MSILDRVTVRPPQSRFRPITQRALFVLHLARKLGEPEAAEHYAELARQHSDETLLLAYRRTLNHGHPSRDLARSFHVELATAREQDPRQRQDGEGNRLGNLLAIKVERRAVAAAVFVGDKLDHHDARSLSSQQEKAQASALGFLIWILREFDITSATMERMTNGNEIRRAQLNGAILQLLQSETIPAWEVSRRELMEAYGHPALQTREQLRQAADGILWSMVAADQLSPPEIDAAALGLHVQIERLFLR